MGNSGLASTTATGPRLRPEGGCAIEWKLVDNVSRHLDLCRVGAATRVAIVSDETADPDLVAAVEFGASRARAGWTRLHLPATAPTDAESVLAGALTAAEVVVDLRNDTTAALGPLVAESDALLIDVAGGADDLRWFGAHQAMADRLSDAARMFDQGEWISVSTTADHVLDIATRSLETDTHTAAPTGLQTRVQWPAGSVTVTPGVNCVNGTVTVMPGAINQGARDAFRSPVVLVFTDNQLADVVGESPDADRLLAQLEALPAEGRHRFQGLEIGMHRSSDAAGLFDPVLVQPARASLSGGHVTLGLGVGTGQQRHPSGLDAAVRLTLRSATVQVDERTTLINDGRLSTDLAPDVYERAALED